MSQTDEIHMLWKENERLIGFIMKLRDEVSSTSRNDLQKMCTKILSEV